MRLLADLARGAAETIRETLPSTEAEAGPFLAGFVWAFVVFWLLVFCVSWAVIGR